MNRVWSRATLSLLVTLFACSPRAERAPATSTSRAALSDGSSAAAAMDASDAALGEGLASLEGAAVDPARGTLDWSLPLPELPSRADFAPTIALTYASTARDVARGFGAGFQLDVPSIEITSDMGTPFRAATADGRDITARLAFGSARLNWVTREQVDGAWRIEYQLDASEEKIRLFRYEDFATISVRDGAAPIRFKGFLVQYPDGRREVYSEESMVAESTASGSGYFTTRWPLQYAISKTGEVVTYEYDYDRADARSYLRAVTFAGGRSRYVFDRLARSASTSSFSAGYEQKATALHSKVTAVFDGAAMYQWCFVYASFVGGVPTIATHADCQARADADFAGARAELASSLSKQDQLIGVYRFGRSVAPGAASEPLLRFRYGVVTANDFANHQLVYDYVVPDVYGFGPAGGAELVDIDADGLNDILRFSAQETASYPAYNEGDLASADGFVRATKLTLTKIDNGIASSVVPRFDQTPQSTEAFLIGDFDGDGRQDLVQATGTTNAASAISFFRGQAKRAQPFGAAVGAKTIDAEISRLLLGRAQTIDLNGDGKSDIVIAVPGTAANWQLLVNVTPAGADTLDFASITDKFPFTGGTDLDNPAYRFLDVNQDGLTDFTVLRVNGAGDKGLCVYENQGAVTSYPSAALAAKSRARLTKNAMAFGSAARNDTMCGNGYFLPISGFGSQRNLNAVWLLDANRDGFVDIVDVGARPDQIEVWLGRGQDGFGAATTLTLNSPVAVDPQNKWNTRILDLDGDGAEEILVYEAGSAGGHVKVIDFNRQGIKNTVSPGLLLEIAEGTGRREAFQYSTSTDERVRELRRLAPSEPRPSSLPSASTVVKRHWSSAGAAAPRVREYAYRGPAFDPITRDFIGFRETTELDYGDDAQESLLTRWTFQANADGSSSDRLLGTRLRKREVGSALLTTAQAARIAASARGWVDRLEQESQTSETWSEEPLAARAVLLRHEEDWGLVPPAPGPTAPAFARLQATRDLACSDTAGCSDASVATRSLSYDELNRTTIEETSLSAVAGPQGTSLPARKYQTTFRYDPAWQARGVLTAVRERTTKALPSGRLLGSVVAAFDTRFALPSTTTATVYIDQDEMGALPAAVRAALPATQTRTQSFHYDAYGNLTDEGDGVSVITRLAFDDAGVLLLRAENARGQKTSFCYGAAGCAIDPGGLAKGPPPEHSLAPTVTRTPDGQITVVDFDDLHRVVRTASSSGSERTIAYRDASGASPQMILVADRRATDGESAHPFVARALAFRADGSPVAAITDDEAGGLVLSYAAYGRRDAPIAHAVPVRVQDSPSALFAEGRLPAGFVTVSCGTGAFSCTLYDAIGRATRKTDAPGRVVIDVEYAPWGHRSTQTVRDESTTTRTRVEVARDEATYAVIDEQGNVHRFDRDEADRLRKTWIAGETTPRLTVFDSEGEIVLSSLPGGLTRVWSRDERGRPREERTWGSGFASWQAIARTFDALDRPLSVSSSSSARATGLSDVTLVYDARASEASSLSGIGHLVEARVDDHLLGSAYRERFDYDATGRLVARDLSFDEDAAHAAFSERWEHALDGTLVAHVDPFGNAFAVTPDLSGAAAAIDWSAPGRSKTPLVTSAKYDARGSLEGYRIPSLGLARTLEHEASTGWLSRARACATATGECRLQDDALVRRADGRIGSIRQSVADGPEIASFAYSPRGELESAAMAGATSAYAFGPSGEVARIDEGGARVFRRDPATALASLPEVGGYTLDDLGQLVAGEGPHGAIYDPEGRLRQVEVADSVVRYGYSAFGARVVKEIRDAASGALRARIFYPTELTRDDGAEQQSIVPLGDHRAAIIVGGHVFGMVDDARGATTALIDEAGETLAVDYSPFGVVRATRGDAHLASTELAFAFTGQLRDADTGWIHMGAREYAPELGSFTSPDPFALAYPELCVTSTLDCHFYAYASHDPINASDPDGYETTSSRSGASAASKPRSPSPSSLASRARSVLARRVGPLRSAVRTSLVHVGAGARTGVSRGTSALARTLASRGVAAARAVSGGSATRVFWAGQGSQAAASAFAHPPTVVTMGMTPIGRVAERITNVQQALRMPWGMQRPVWAAASRVFAVGASGEVHVFHGPAVSIRSVWATVEYKALKANVSVTEITYHDAF